jgi:hypothetical protein
VQVVEFGREPEHKIAPGRSIFGIAAINVVSSEYRRVAKIFQATATVRTISINAPNPRHANARAEGQLGGGAIDDISYDLVPRDEWALSLWQVPFDNMQIGAAHPARANSKKHVTRCQLWLGSFFDLKILFNGLEDGGFQAWLLLCDVSQLFV